MSYQKINVYIGPVLDRLPDYAMGNEIELTRCSGNRIALCKRSFFCSVKLFEPDGTMIRNIPLPFTVVYAAVRNDRIYGFSPDRDCILLDLEGNPIPLPWKDWPKEKVYYDMSPDGSLLLYLEACYPSAHLDGIGEYRIKNLDTGVEVKLEKGMWEQEPKFLDNETVLQRIIRGYDGLVRFDARTGKRIGYFIEERLCSGYRVDKENGRVYAGLSDWRREGETWWATYSLNRELLYESAEQGRGVYSDIAIPQSGLAAYILVKDKNRLEENELCIHDCRLGSTIYRETVGEGAKIYIRPDGRELYIMRQREVHVRVLERGEQHGR